MEPPSLFLSDSVVLCVCLRGFSRPKRMNRRHRSLPIWPMALGHAFVHSGDSM